MLKALWENLKNTFEYKGQTKRADFWWFNLASLVVLILLAYLSVMLFVTASLYTSVLAKYGAYVMGGLAIIFCIWTLLAWVSASVRRLHNTKRSGWWTLLVCLPLVGPITLVLMQVQESK